VLYEMLSGRRAFKGNTAADTQTAILKEDPPELSEVKPPVPPPFQHIVRRCLEKEPERRFQSAHDLAFALEALSGSGSEALSPGLRAPRSKRRAVAVAVAVASLVALAVAYLRRPTAGSGAGPPRVSFQQLTFRQGGLHEARFGPDGNVFYSAHWSGKADDVYFTRPGNPEGRSLGLGNARLLSVSSSGELALGLGASDTGVGSLARLTFPGGAPRELVSKVSGADWSPDGRGLAIVRGRHTLEFPEGKVLYQSEARIGPPRFSPQGDRIAFFESSLSSGDRPTGTIWSVDLEGSKTSLFRGTMDEEDGLAWSASGGELWFVSRPETGDGSLLRAVDRNGKLRDVQTLDGWASLADIAPSGDVLLQRYLFQQGLVVIDRDGREQDLTWLNRSQINDMSEDGRTILFTERIHESPFVYVRRRDEADAVRLGEGEANALSPDGKWALGNSKETFVLYPLGAGSPRVLPLTGVKPPFDIHWALWFPDGKRLLIEIYSFETQSSRLYALDLATARLEPLSPEDRSAGTSMTHPFSPDARRLLVSVQNDRPYGIYTLEGGGFEDIGLSLGDLPIRWSADGRYVFYRARPDQRRVYRLDLQSRRKELWKELRVDAMSGVSWVVTTGDGKSIGYTYNRWQADLYLVKGLR
jgi:hypothetical protein